jgi:hypothetical protein
VYNANNKLCPNLLNDFGDEPCRQTDENNLLSMNYVMQILQIIVIITSRNNLIVHMDKKIVLFVTQPQILHTRTIQLLRK